MTRIRWDIANTLSKAIDQLHRLADADSNSAALEQFRAHVLAVREGRVSLDHFADLYMLRPEQKEKRSGRSFESFEDCDGQTHTFPRR